MRLGGGGTQEPGRGSQGTVALLHCFSAPWSPYPLQHLCGAQPSALSGHPSVAGDKLCHSILATSWVPGTPSTPLLPVSVSGLTSPH